MMGGFAWRRVASLACGVVLLVSACGDSGDGAADSSSTTALPTTVPQSSTPSTVTAGPGLPGPGEPWDVLLIGYDLVIGIDEGLTPSPGELYAAQAADILDAEVRLFEPPGFDHTYTAMFVEQLRGDRYPPLDEYVPPAEIIILWSRPGFAPDGSDKHIQADYDSCHREAAGGTPPTVDFSDEYWAAYRGFLDEMYDELWALREGTPTVLITADWDNAWLPEQRASGIELECTDWIDAWSTQIAEAAIAHGSHFVSILDVFNGPDRDRDPAESGYVDGAGVTEAGAQLIADALLDVGFDAVTQP